MQKNQRSNCQHPLDHQKSKSVPESALLTMPKPLMCGPQRTLENSSKMGIPDHLTCLLRNLYAGQEATLELDMLRTSSAASHKFWYIIGLFLLFILKFFISLWLFGWPIVCPCGWVFLISTYLWIFWLSSYHWFLVSLCLGNTLDRISVFLSLLNLALWLTYGSWLYCFT